MFRRFLRSAIEGETPTPTEPWGPLTPCPGRTQQRLPTTAKLLVTALADSAQDHRNLTVQRHDQSAEKVRSPTGGPTRLGGVEPLAADPSSVLLGCAQRRCSAKNASIRAHASLADSGSGPAPLTRISGRIQPGPASLSLRKLCPAAGYSRTSCCTPARSRACSSLPAAPRSMRSR